MKLKLNPAGCISLLILFLILVSGCGKKGPPLLPAKEMLAPPTELVLTLEGNMATLTWLHMDKGDAAPSFAGFEIDEATRDISPDACKGCPLQFKPLDTVDARTFRYTVMIEPQFIYYYRVRAYTDDKLFSNSSSTVQVRIEP